jgi:hypothetical protein
MYGLGDNLHDAYQANENLARLLHTCYEYISKVPNENELEKTLILSMLSNFKE